MGVIPGHSPFASILGNYQSPAGDGSPEESFAFHFFRECYPTGSCTEIFLYSPLSTVYSGPGGGSSLLFQDSAAYSTLLAGYSDPEGWSYISRLLSYTL